MAVHGGNTEEIARKYKLNPSEIIDFSANINPLGISENVKKAMIDAIDKVVKYPDITYFDLKNSIGEFEKLDISNGSVAKATMIDSTNINIGQITYDTGSYLIIGTPIIFVTY